MCDLAGRYEKNTYLFSEANTLGHIIYSFKSNSFCCLKTWMNKTHLLVSLQKNIQVFCPNRILLYSKHSNYSFLGNFVFPEYKQDVFALKLPKEKSVRAIIYHLDSWVFYIICVEVTRDDVRLLTSSPHTSKSVQAIRSCGSVNKQSNITYSCLHTYHSFVFFL